MFGVCVWCVRPSCLVCKALMFGVYVWCVCLVCEALMFGV